MTDYQRRIREELIDSLEYNRERALDMARDYGLDFCDTKSIDDWAECYDSAEDLVNAVLNGNITYAYSEKIRRDDLGRLEEVSEWDLEAEVGDYIEEIADIYLQDDNEYEEAGNYDEPGPAEVLNILRRDNIHTSYLIGWLIGKGYIEAKKTFEVLEQFDMRNALEFAIRSHLDIDDLNKLGWFDVGNGVVRAYDDAHLWQLAKDFPGMVYGVLVHYRDEIVKNCYENNDYFDLDEIGAPSAMCYVLKHLDC